MSTICYFAKRRLGETAFNIFNYVGMAVVWAIFVYPLLYVASRSVMPDAERVARPLALIPLQLDFTAYKLVFAPNPLLFRLERRGRSAEHPQGSADCRRHHPRPRLRLSGQRVPGRRRVGRFTQRPPL
jgi:hypothetical protein